MRSAVEKERNEEWEREDDVGEQGGCPIGKEPDVPIGTLNMSVDWRYEVVAPCGWLPAISSKAEGAICVELVKQWRQERKEGVEAGYEYHAWVRKGRRHEKGIDYQRPRDVKGKQCTIWPEGGSDGEIQRGTEVALLRTGEHSWSVQRFRFRIER
jgi:hypothetical protein